MSIKKYGLPYVGEELSVKKETGNSHDTFAVAVIKDVVGHLPQGISRNVTTS